MFASLITLVLLATSIHAYEIAQLPLATLIPSRTQEMAPHPTVPRGATCVCPTTPVVTSTVTTIKGTRTTVSTTVTPFTFTSGAIEKAIGLGSQVNTAPSTGTTYPHIFNNREQITYAAGCAATTVVEFPIWTDISKPGADTNRVLYGYGDFEFCGCITHLGAAGVNGFVACKF